jgi:hypothetical protein
MKRFAILLAAGVLAAAGCTDTHHPTESSGRTTEQVDEAKIKANLDKLSPDDRAIAESQKSCPIGGERLGSMGTPVKLDVKGQPVFICCEGCKNGALKDPEKTLQKVEELKKENGK